MPDVYIPFILSEDETHQFDVRRFEVSDISFLGNYCDGANDMHHQMLIEKKYNSKLKGFMVLRPDSKGLSIARRNIVQVSKQLSLPYEDVLDIVVAVGEALSNAYLHGTPNYSENLIYLSWKTTDSALVVVVEDEGNGFTSFKSNARIWSELSGIGIQLMKHVVDEVSFEKCKGMKVTISKYLS